MTLVFLLEELSMKVFLEGLLPRVLPEDVHFILISHEGKSDLEKSIPRKLKAWRDKNARFVIVRDQDSDDCKTLKAHLLDLCAPAKHASVLVRIVCRELESWYLADLQALDAAYGTALAPQQSKRRFRDPDQLTSPSRELERLVPGFGKVSGGRLLGPRVNVSNRRSPSFATFMEGVRRVSSGGASV